MPSRTATTALVATALGLSPGCAHEPKDGATSMEELGRTVQSLRAQNASYRRQIEELENRLFILTDQLDSRKVNGEKAATPELPRELPRVTLRPDAKAAPAPEEPVEESSEPIFEGDADPSKRRGPNPVLRLYGNETPVLTLRDPEPPRAPRIVVTGEAAREPRPAAPRPQPALAPVDLYRRSLEALRAGRHADATAGFRDFLRQHAAHDFADNAQYWLGECFYDQKDYPNAVREFRRVVERYPQGNKVPDALLKVAYSYLAIGSAGHGRETLEQLVRAYPRHEAAGLAAAKLTEIAAAPPVSDSKTPTRSPRPTEEVP